MADVKPGILRLTHLVNWRGVFGALVALPAMAALRLRNLFSRSSVLGDAQAVVSLTSYGRRIERSFYAIEAIGRGRTRPSRLILWLDDADKVRNPPRPLRRLQARGLEILPTPDYGPHKKYYPYARQCRPHRLPLVTADDDALYDAGWLAGLMEFHRRYPDCIGAHRAHLMTLTAGCIDPYVRWGRAEAGLESLRTFATGMSGVLYPPAFLERLAEAGEDFRAVAPHADDVWLHVMALRCGFAVRQIAGTPGNYPAVGGTQMGSLWISNVLGGGNDGQIRATYTTEDIQRLWQDQLLTGRMGRMKIVIAGGHGQIALLATRRLADAGHEVIGLVRNPAHEADIQAAGGRAVVLDLETASVEEAAQVLQGADAVVFAAGAGPGSGAARKDTVDRAASVLLADAAEAAGVKRFVQISAIGLEGVRGGARPEGMDDVFHAYLVAKLAAEDDLRARDGLDWTILRPGRLTDSAGSGRVQLRESVEHADISRADVARVLAQLVTTGAGRHRALELVAGDEQAEAAVARYS